MNQIITTAAVLIIATILVSLVTASDLHKQRRRIVKLEQAVLERERELEEVAGQKKIVDGSLALHTGLRDERQRKITELNEELEYLKEDRVSERDIKMGNTRKNNSDLDEET